MASLLALARERTSVKRAVIASFSPRLNDAMTAYVSTARDHIAAGENLNAAQLLNDTVGRHLPRIMKLYNYRYLSTLPRDEQQVAFHVDQILAIRPGHYLHEFSHIDCGLKFINGELDEYTTSDDVRSLAPHLPSAQFETIAHAGHFFDLEGKAALRRVRTAILDYFGPAPAQSDNRSFDCFDALAERSSMPPAQQSAPIHDTAVATAANVALQAVADHSFQQVELP